MVGSPANLGADRFGMANGTSRRHSRANPDSCGATRELLPIIRLTAPEHASGDMSRRVGPWVRGGG
jgi:hypothetical protein